MASGPLVGGGGGGGDGSREKHRWSESKVYTRKSHNKGGAKPSSTTANPPPPKPPSSSNQTLATTTDDLNSSLHQPPPPPPPPPRLAASDDDSSSLNHHRLPNGAAQRRRVTISLASRPGPEVRELRRKLSAELDLVRSLVKKLEAKELQLSSAMVAAPASQLSANNPTTPVAAPARRQLSISLPAGAAEPESSSLGEKEKRTPKANQYYRNSDFVLGKEKFPPPDAHSHKKSKANGSSKKLDHIMSESNKRYGQAFKSCATLLRKLMKHKHGWVFNHPVDVKALGLHDYKSIIKHPMDLGTVKSRLSKNWYKSPEEFAEDVRLTFRNAMTYNPKGQDVHVMAEQLNQIFEEEWPSIEAEYSYNSYLLAPPVAKKPPPLDMRRILERSDSTVHPTVAESKMKPVNSTPHIGRPPALKKPKAKDPHKRDMTFEEKQKLSNNLQNLPPEKLDNIVQIIKKRNSALSQHDDEIEVDIDSVDAETLWELDRFVTNYKKSLSKHKRKAELAVLARTEAESHPGREMVQERIPDPVVADVPKESKTVVDEKNVVSSSPVEEKKGDNASRSSSSSSSSSDSGSSSSDSDSESSSAYGSDAAHSPRT